MLSLVLVACSTDSSSENPTPDTSTPTNNEPENKEGDDVAEEAPTGGDLIIAVTSDAPALDPHKTNDVPSSNVAYNIYESLVALNDKNELQPLLATEWNLVNDTTWEFKLREGVKFHDGSDFNAEVVKANFERLLDPDIASQRLFLYEMISEINVIDEFTVHFVTAYPFAPLVPHLAHSGGGMISLEAIKADYEAMEAGEVPGSVIGVKPIGTGFFKFDSWVSGEQITLVRNDDYWGEKAKLDSVTFKVVNEPLTRLSELETGYSHIIDKVQPNSMQRVKSNPDLYLDETSLTSLSYISFNNQKPPFDDVRVRKAISMAINKDDIVQGIYDGAAVPAVGPIAPGVFGFDDTVTPIPYDPEAAKELLAEAGYEKGFTTTLWTNDNAERVRIAEYVQDKLSEIGVQVTIEVVEWTTYLEDTAAGKHDMFILGWSTPTGDADYSLYAVFHSKNHGLAGNRSFFSDAQVDDLLDKGRQEPDPDQRRVYYKEAQERLVELAPMLYTHYTIELTGVSQKVKGFWVTTNGLYMLRDVTLEQ